MIRNLELIKGEWKMKKVLFATGNESKVKRFQKGF